MGLGRVITKPKQFEVYLVPLDPTQGAEMKKTRPCVVLSPNELNRSLATVIIAPMTSKRRNYAFRTKTNFKDMEGEIVLDQMRAVSKSRLKKYIGHISHIEANQTLLILQSMFAG